MEAIKIGTLILAPVLLALGLLLGIVMNLWMVVFVLGMAIGGAFLIVWWVDFIVKKYA